jgi:glycerate 2-kinase
MRIVYAPDSYGGFLSAPAACRLVRKVLGLRGMGVDLHPMADGGEGSLEVLRFHGVAGSVEVVESARWLGPACESMAGPWHGRSSVDLGRRLARPGDGPLVVGLGGTATMDGGAGALQALGLTLRDQAGRTLPVGLPAHQLGRVVSVRGPVPLRGRLLELLCDVTSPLGRAPELYGPQKGLDGGSVDRQRQAMGRWARVLGEWRQRHGMAPLPVELPGGGAAGGLGFALASVGARIVPGAPRIARLTGLVSQLRGADVVVLGEGRLDRTSFEGKVADVVLGQARRQGVPRVLALVGSVRESLPPPAGPDAIIQAVEPGIEAFIVAIQALGDALVKMS